MEFIKVLAIAKEVKEQLSPHCFRCEIAGSIRRRKPEIKDIDIVLIAKPYEFGLLQSGVAAVINQWQSVRGKFPCQYTRRLLPEGIELDIWLVEEKNWGYHFAIRTGSEGFNRRVLVRNWNKRGFKGEGGFLTKDKKIIEVREEEDLFKLIGLPFISPERRK